jgi:AraC family transcriptional regulator of adaptative response/methylated-DNA-[protein]-cysteine methyltransferase
VTAACEAIQRSEGERVGLNELARGVGLSPGHLRRLFQASLGVTPRAYADALRLKALRARLREGDMVTGSLYEVGYGSSSRLYEASNGRLGMTPATYRRGGGGIQLQYATAPSPLGRVLVAVTGAGVAAVCLGDTDEALVAELRNEFPGAVIAPDGEGLPGVLAEVLHRVSGGVPRAEIPLDIRATAFQRRVWDALLRIPRGETRTYGELARTLGSGPRAVARACATNRLAVLVPCHRVVGRDGDLRGYRWGNARKKALLRDEAVAPPGAGRARPR